MIDLWEVANESVMRKEELASIDTSCPGCGTQQVQLVGHSKERFNMRCRHRKDCGLKFDIIRRL